MKTVTAPGSGRFTLLELMITLALAAVLAALAVPNMRHEGSRGGERRRRTPRRLPLRHIEPSPRAHGFSMVEALVALVVLGVGMLGIASLYVVTLRSSGSAISRMQAVNLASDIGDRIRANRNAGIAYAGPAAATGDACIGPDKNCSPEEMAAHDLYLWQEQIRRTLPGDPTGTVNVDAVAQPATYTITVAWLEAGSKAGGANENRQSYVMRMQI